ncbi:sucrose transport protein SUT1-like isoform X2 [Asparagus officinalis]|uniref:sucrose transport protein SUT1-like isoform X1 n=1 Tax=Asparagus officinalis TaxID=4686 RepID=UPI00098DFAEA|nr:sucrose transport protein SUT1-like isoform X1 [Asparagus officinalis]XP_020257325.1 sucrose transport protein SUT1-like isoform X2 [Asparagus officinalis]
MDLERNETGRKAGRGEVELAAANCAEIAEVAPATAAAEISLTRLIFGCVVAGGVQYGWALQLSLLTPYVQTLGLSHALSSLMWLCGPLAGFIVQPCVGLYSDKCRSRFGRRRPFILAGCLLICLAVTVIGFSSDIGYALGDTKEDCSVYHGPRWKAAFIFVGGFWVLDFANNAVQGPARALMADLSGRFGCNAANAIFASWMAFGNILGYSSGSTGEWHNWFPFLKTRACCDACANLKGAFLVAVVFLLLSMLVTLIVAKEVPLCSIPGKGEEEHRAEFLDIFRSIKNLPPGMPSVLFITGLTWLSWFPFILFDTDWMGREVFHGNPKGTPSQIDAFDRGVRAGAFGLLLNSIILGIGSFMIEPLCRKLTPRIVWVTSNFMVCLAMAATAIMSVWSMHNYTGGGDQYIGPDGKVKAVALFLFAALGLPLAVLYSVPFAVTATLAASRGGGQGLCTGVLNISIVVPQVIVALGAGPWDQLFGKGNIPAFALASAFAFVCGCLGLFMLPKLSRSTFKTSGVGGMH